MFDPLSAVEEGLEYRDAAEAVEDPVPLIATLVKVLFVKVCDAVRVTKVSVISGTVRVLFADVALDIVNVVELAFALHENPIRLEFVVESTKKFVSVSKFLL